MGYRLGEHLEGLGITAADRAVMEFLYPEGRLSVPEISRRCRVSRQHVQVTVNSLVDKGLAETRESPGRKRSPLISLTGDMRGGSRPPCAGVAELTLPWFAGIFIAGLRTSLRLPERQRAPMTRPASRS